MWEQSWGETVQSRPSYGQRTDTETCHLGGAAAQVTHLGLLCYKVEVIAHT